MNTSTKKAVKLETTPRVYYEHYMTAPPSYDLYPSLSRRLNNGYIYQPIQKPKKQQQTNFIVLNTSRSTSSLVNNDPLWQATFQQQEQDPSWDLYPSILRNIENFGTDQMRQRLHRMQATISL